MENSDSINLNNKNDALLKYEDLIQNISCKKDLLYMKLCVENLGTYSKKVPAPIVSFYKIGESFHPALFKNALVSIPLLLERFTAEEIMGSSDFIMFDHKVNPLVFEACPVIKCSLCKRIFGFEPIQYKNIGNLPKEKNKVKCIRKYIKEPICTESFCKECLRFGIPPLVSKIDRQMVENTVKSYADIINEEKKGDGSCKKKRKTKHGDNEKEKNT